MSVSREEQVGNQRRFTANPDSPVFEELKSLVRKTLGVVANYTAFLQLQRALERLHD